MIFLANDQHVFVTIADLHGGAFDSKIWWKECSEEFLGYLEKHDFDTVFLAGDLFDDKLSANSPSAEAVIRFMTRLLKLCEKQSAKCRIIKGTESHDNRQLALLEPLALLTECDFRVIHTVEVEQLESDVKVLYLPEEYMDNQEEYYKPYFDVEEPYDVIIGHGLIDKAAFMAVTQESEETMAKAPIIKHDTLMKISKGPVYFGHVHSKMQVDRFRYVSSFSRWSFGESEEKGFLVTKYTPETGAFTEKFIVNKLARKFDTVKITYPNTLQDDGEKAQMDHLVELAKNLLVDYLRLEILIPEDHPQPMLITSMITELFARNKFVKLKIINDRKSREQRQVEEKVQLLLDRFNFIFNKKLTPSQKLSQYIKLQSGVEISEEKVDFYLTQNIINED